MFQLVRGYDEGIRMSEDRSILFNAVETFGVPQGLPETLAVLDMAAEVADAGVEDIVECVFTKEDVADHPHHSSEHRVCPQSS